MTTATGAEVATRTTLSGRTGEGGAPLPRTLRRGALTILGAALLIVYVYWVHPSRVASGAHHGIPEDVGHALKAFVAGVAALLTAAFAVGRALRVPFRVRRSRAVLAGACLVAVASYVNFGDAGYSQFYHRWEFFHYYMGAKYSGELGYKGIYVATLAARLDDGAADRSALLAAPIRDLEADRVVPANTLLDQAEQAKARFTPPRWAAFKSDVAFFRSQCSPDWFRDMQTDHGYNPSPVWTLVGKAFATVVPASTEGMRALAGIDLLLATGCVLLVGWAFGDGVLAIFLLFWGAQWATGSFFTWGAYLRQDWLFATIASACLARKRRFHLAGAALAYAAAVRVFPAAIFFGPLLLAVDDWRKGVRDSNARAFLVGGAVAGAGLVLATIAFVGFGAFPEFIGQMGAYSRSMMTNTMGLRTTLVYSFTHPSSSFPAHAGDRYAAWRAWRLDRIESLRFVHVTVCCACLVAYGWTALRIRRLWVAVCLGAILPVILLEVNSYYFTVLLLLPLLAAYRPVVGPLALGTAAIASFVLVWPRVTKEMDTRCFVESVILIGFALVSLGLVLWTARTKTPAHRPARS